jgi:hypothetical protein
MPRPKGSKNTKKSELVSKVSQESGIEEEKLERLPVSEIKKIDDLIPDVDLLGEEPKERIFLGYHPITGVEVWH